MKQETQYVTCEQCNRKMHGTGCKGKLDINGKIYPRIRYGEHGEYAEGLCHDCGCKEGQIHHWGCDNEYCPKCSGQAGMFCECGENYQLVIDTKKTIYDWCAIAKDLKKGGLAQKALEIKWKPTFVKTKKDKDAWNKALRKELGV